MQVRNSHTRVFGPWAGSQTNGHCPCHQLPQTLDTCLRSDAAVATAQQPITLSAAARAQVQALRATQAGDTVLRCGVRAGGCSGMSYTMDFVPRSAITEDDTTIALDDGLDIVVDPKSLLYLYGLHLDFSSALIGGGFKFANPSAEQTCGCGTSFTAKAS